MSDDRIVAFLNTARGNSQGCQEQVCMDSAKSWYSAISAEENSRDLKSMVRRLEQNQSFRSIDMPSKKSYDYHF